MISMSALPFGQNVRRPPRAHAEVTNLQGAVEAWTQLDPAHRTDAILTLERAIHADGMSLSSFEREGIGVLAERLPR